MNNETIYQLESLGFTVDISHDTEWDTHKVVTHFHGNEWASVERHDLEGAIEESLYIVKSGIYGNPINT
jgi:hypothetical protein